MKTFQIEIKETLAAVRAVQADTVDQAIALVKNRYLNEEIVLDANHFVDVDFQSLEDSKEDCTNNIGNKSLQPIYEIVRIKAERRKLPKKYLSENLTDYTVRSPHDFAKIAMKFIGDEDREVFLVACLSTKNQIQSLHRCHIGSLNASIVTPREVFKTAFLQNAASILVAHNHPSQNCTPSPEDIDVTKRLKEAGELLGVELLDHCARCS